MDIHKVREILHAAQAQERFAESLVAVAENSTETQRQAEIRAEVELERAEIDKRIVEVAKQGGLIVSYDFTSRISADQKSHSEVEEIKSRAWSVACRILKTLENDGFQCYTEKPKDVLDIRQANNEKPEYHIIPINVIWTTEA